jgi:hypothetical protein
MTIAVHEYPFSSYVQKAKTAESGSLRSRIRPLAAESGVVT